MSSDLYYEWVFLCYFKFCPKSVGKKSPATHTLIFVFLFVCTAFINLFELSVYWLK